MNGASEKQMSKMMVPLVTWRIPFSAPSTSQVRTRLLVSLRKQKQSEGNFHKLPPLYPPSYLHLSPYALSSLITLDKLLIILAKPKHSIYALDSISSHLLENIVSWPSHFFPVPSNLPSILDLFQQHVKHAIISPILKKKTLCLISHTRLVTTPFLSFLLQQNIWKSLLSSVVLFSFQWSNYPF